MTVFKRTETWASWAGTLGDVADAIQLGIDALTVSNMPAGVSIAVEERGFEAAHMPIDELRAYEPLSGMRAITQVTARITQMRTIELRAARTLNPQAPLPAMQLAVEGVDRTWVEGTAKRMQQRLDRGKRFSRGYGPNSWLAIIGVLIGLLVPLVIATALTSYGTNHHWRVAALVSLWVAAAAAMLFTVALWLSIPSLELLKPGQLRRVQRLKAWFIALVIGVLAAAVVAILFAAIPLSS